MSVKLTSANLKSSLEEKENRRNELEDKPCEFNKMEDKRPPAVVVRNAEKTYWRGATVIKNLNMTIRQGGIYSLLGSSGCGKTTTLSCIVGLTKFSSGNVWVFGKKPGGGQGVPGKSVGYMPQDYSLHDDFSILETLTYFGMLNGMTTYQIINAIVFYTNLLKLPTEPQTVGSLSGGQKRRLSFAVALIHEPKLLILDEPTVGVDPLLRESIWKHLVHLSKINSTTVIITTHYIEEARCSDTIGVMRNGRLLAENSPEHLIQQFNAISLEAVVLQLCRISKDAKRRGSTVPINDIEIGRNRKKSLTPGSDDHPIHPSAMASITRKKDNVGESITRIRALTQKYMYGMMRSLTLLMFMIIIPVFSIYVNFIAMGLDSHHIKFGVVNNELSNSSSTCHELSQAWKGTCDLNFWSCKYLSHLPPGMFSLRDFSTTELAEKAVKSGQIRGFIQFPNDFSWEFYERAASSLKMDPLRLNESNIVIRLDQTNSIITHQIQFGLYTTFAAFVKDLVQDCGYNPKKAEYSLQYKDPIVGKKDLTNQEFMLPGVIIVHIFYWPIISTGIRFVHEKRQGTMERSLVAGIHMWEIFLAYSVTELLTTAVKLALMYGMAVWMFQMPVIGSLVYQFLLGLLAGYMGVAAGFLFGSFCTEEIQVALLSMAIFVPNNILSGIIWPIEAMSLLLQKISVFLPCTLACEAMRSLTLRGWEFTHPNVWPGFVSTFLHTLIYFVLAIVISTFKFIK